MPSDRLTWPKALKLMHTIGEASPIIDLYLMAMNGPPFDTYPAWKKNWCFQTLKTLRQLLWLFLSHPVACCLQPEGSQVALKFENIRGRLTTLKTLAGRYKKLLERIRYSAWAQPGMVTSSVKA